MLSRLILVAILTVGPAFAASADCSNGDRQTTGCPTVTATLDNDAAVLNGNSDSLNQGDPSAPNSHTGDSSDSSTPTPGAQPFRDPFLITELPDVTLADIAAFRPDPAIDHSEPRGWTIAGLDTNFYATGGSGIKDGTLLGLPASVRFTPVAWHWSYGDGRGASRATPGASWSAQGIREFDATATSHIYNEYGTFTIDLVVDYAAEYRFAGGSWLEIDGVLSLPANQLVISVGSAKTVLVERECTRNPAGPGC